MVKVCLILALVAVAGAANAVQDKLQFHFKKSIFADFKNQSYWNPLISWANKYKPDLKTPRWPFSNTVFSFLTDGWHLYQFIELTAWQLAFGLSLAYANIELFGIVHYGAIEAIIYFLTLKAVYSGTFELFFKYLLARKK